MKVYVAIESVMLHNTASSFASEDLGGHADVCLSRESAIAAVNSLIYGQVEEEYGDNENYTPDDLFNMSMEVFNQTDGTLEGDEWHWDATNRSCVWRIIETEVWDE